MKNRLSLTRLLSEASLKKMAGRMIFARGKEYYQSDAVELLLDHNNKLLGKVEGIYEYTVRFWIEGDELEYDCDCPYDDFCKYLVAVGLAYLKGESEAAPDVAAFEAEFAELDDFAGI